MNLIPPRHIDQLNLAQCRRLLKIGMPFDYHPQMFLYPLHVWQDDVSQRIEQGQITWEQVDAVLTPKPRTVAATKVCRACTIRDRGMLRVPAVTVYPNGTLSVRLLGNQRAETTTIEAVYHMAVKQRVQSERADKARAKKARKA